MQALNLINISCPCGGTGFVAVDDRIILRVNGNGLVERCKGVAVEMHVAINTAEKIVSTYALKGTAVRIITPCGYTYGRV